MSDISPSGSTVTIPNSNLTVPGIDTFNDFVSKVNASLNALSTSVINAAPSTAIGDITKAVNDANVKVQSDLKTAIDDLNTKFQVAVTSSQPTKTAPPTTSYGWVFPVVGLLLAWFFLEKKHPL